MYPRQLRPAGIGLKTPGTAASGLRKSLTKAAVHHSFAVSVTALFSRSRHDRRITKTTRRRQWTTKRRVTAPAWCSGFGFACITTGTI